MTPLFRLFDRFLPRWLVYLTLSLTYAGMMAGVLLFHQPLGDAIVYIDFRG